MEQTKSLTALAPYLALCNSVTSPRQAADVVTQATTAPNTYVFAELLETGAMQSLRLDGTYGGYYRVLEVFSWGTMGDYSRDSTLPKLSEAQERKLRLLTLLSLAAEGEDMSYEYLMGQLGLTEAKELEELVTKGIYADLLKATLDPARRRVVISSVAPLRDAAPGQLGRMVGELEQWIERCDGVLADLGRRVEEVKGKARERADWEEGREGQRERAEGRWGGIAMAEDGRRGRGGFDDNAMDLDGDGLGGQVHPGRRKGGGWFGRKK